LSVGVALLSTPVQAQAEGGPSCSATVEVTGDMEVAQDISAMLSRRGLPPPSHPSVSACPPVTARVREHAGMLEVEIDDGQGRRQERRVGSLEAAAALIESWARVDLPDPLLSRRPRP